MSDDLNIFTLEIDGRPILMFAREDLGEAERAFEGQGVQAPLHRVGRVNGKPLWDGRSKKSVRESTPAERVRFHLVLAAMREECVEGVVGGDDDNVVYCMAVRGILDDAPAPVEDQGGEGDAGGKDAAHDLAHEVVHDLAHELAHAVGRDAVAEATHERAGDDGGAAGERATATYRAAYGEVYEESYDVIYGQAYDEAYHEVTKGAAPGRPSPPGLPLTSLMRIQIVTCWSSWNRS